MAMNTCEMWSNAIKIAFFSKKLTKIAQRFFVTKIAQHYKNRFTKLTKTKNLQKIAQNRVNGYEHMRNVIQCD